METQTKQCKHCKETINKLASRCPKCGGKNYVWTTSRKVILGLVLFLVLVGILGSSGGSNPSAPPISPLVDVPQSQQQQIQITEAQCIALKTEFYSLIAQQPFDKTRLGKELLEQYADNAGIPVVRSNPKITYVLPKSDCGNNLDTTLKVIITGEKNSGLR